MKSLVALLPNQLRDAEVFVAELVALYGAARAEAIITQLGKPSLQCYWFNKLLALDTDTHVPPVASTAVPGLAGVWCTDPELGLSRTPGAESGEIYIQNPSSFYAVKVLNPRPGEEVLDLAAAPGGKTIAMAVGMANQGRIAAVEPVKPRFHRLRANVARCGVTIVDFYPRDGRGVGRVVPERFDKVLLDAPCSSQARMRWFDPTTFTHWSRQKVKEAQRKQKSLIRSAYAALKPGGLMVYCTCAFSVAENELVVDYLLKRSDAVLQKLSDKPVNSVPGVNVWNNKPLHQDLSRSLRILPDDIWDGFFIALILKPA